MSPVTAILSETQPTMRPVKGNNCYGETYSPGIAGLGRYAIMTPATIADVHLKRAAEQAEREGSERPLVMQQLRAKIQLERLREGKEELTVHFEEPRKYQLTKEEEKKLEKRKERNREAAKRSRVKKRHQHSDLQKRNRKLKEKNGRLRTQINELYDLTSTLQKSVQDVRKCYHSLPAKPLHTRARQYLSQPPSGQSGQCGHSNMVVPSRGMSPQFSTFKQSIMGGSSSIPATCFVDAGVATSLATPALSSSQDVRILSSEDPAYTVTSSLCISPDVVAMDSFYRIVPSLELGDSIQPKLTIVVGKKSDHLSIARPAGPSFPQGVDDPLPRGGSYLQLLEGPDSPEMVVDPKNEAVLTPAYVVRQGTLLTLPPSGFYIDDMTTSPRSPSSPDMTLKTTSPRSPSSPNMALALQRLTRGQ